jgi:hypothetical protein
MKHSCILCIREDENDKPIHSSSFIVHRFLRMKKIVLFLLLFACLSSSCDEEIQSTIPNAPVSLNVDLNLADYRLKSNTAYEMITQPRIVSDKLGYGGLLIINGMGIETVNLFAYDLACPVEVQRNVRIVPNNMSSSGSDILMAITATCPKCGAVFNIANGYGSPESGTKLFLKSYKVVQKIKDIQYYVIN